MPGLSPEANYRIALTPVFEGTTGVLELRPTENRRARFLSDDGGFTWRFDRVYNPGGTEDETLA